MYNASEENMNTLNMSLADLPLITDSSSHNPCPTEYQTQMERVSGALEDDILFFDEKNMEILY